MGIYVMSDIHGQYAVYKKMLRKIGFGKKDHLYILGDVIDRGPDGIKILMDIMKKPNIELILGNHELMMLDSLDNLETMRKRERSDSEDYEIWVDASNGGFPTYKSFMMKSEANRQAIVEYLEKSWIIKRIKVGSKTYHLSHSYTVWKPIGEGFSYSEMTHSEISSVVWHSVFDKQFRHEVGKRLFPDENDIYIVGHIFTQRIDSVDAFGRGCVYHEQDFKGFNIYNIDCGMALMNKTSQLACVRLDPYTEIYVGIDEEDE